MLDPAALGETLAETAAGAQVEAEVGRIARVGVVLRPPAGDTGEGSQRVGRGDDQLDGVADFETVRIGM